MAKTKPRAKPTAPKSSVPLKAKAAAWGADGTLAVLAARGATLVGLVVRDGRIVDEVSAISRAKRIAILPSGTILTIDGDGKARASGDGAPRSVHTKLSVVELAVCGGIAYVGGWHGSLGKLDEAAGTWSGLGLRDAIAPHLPADGPSAKGKIHSIIEGSSGPIVGVYCTYHQTVVFEWTGAWKLRGKIDARVNALARSPDDDIVYAIGDELWALDGTRTRKLAALEYGEDQWSAGWLAGKSGGLLTADLASVSRLSLDGTLKEILRARREVPDNHSLFVSGTNAAFVAGGSVFVLDGKAFHELEL